MFGSKCFLNHKNYLLNGKERKKINSDCICDQYKGLFGSLIFKNPVIGPLLPYPTVENMWIMAGDFYENLFPIQPGAILPHGIYSAAPERTFGNRVYML